MFLVNNVSVTRGDKTITHFDIRHFDGVFDFLEGVLVIQNPLLALDVVLSLFGLGVCLIKPMAGNSL